MTVNPPADRTVTADSTARTPDPMVVTNSSEGVGPVVTDDKNHATECDECRSPIAYGETCYAVRTGENDTATGAPYVRIECGRCRA